MRAGRGVELRVVCDQKLSVFVLLHQPHVLLVCGEAFSKSLQEAAVKEHALSGTSLQTQQSEQQVHLI